MEDGDNKLQLDYPRSICVQYLRILLSSFGEEDFQRFAINLLCSNCLSLLFRKTMQVAPPFEQTLIAHTQGLFMCNI